MLSGRSTACLRSFRSLSIGEADSVFPSSVAARSRRWMEASRKACYTIVRRPLCWRHGNLRRWHRSAVSTPFLPATSARISFCSSSKNTILRHTDKPSSGWKIATIFAAIASGACFDHFRTTGTNDDDDDDRNFGEPRGPVVARLTKRRDTSIRISFGDSLLVDHAEPLPSTTVAGANDEEIVLLLPEDKETISPFLYYLMTHVKLVRVQKDEQHLYSPQLPIGMPGLGCKYCKASGKEKTRRQIYPFDRRTFPKMVRQTLYNHVRRCEWCPPEVKLELRRLKKLETGNKISKEERLFFRRLWFRMGHKTEI